ncbi:hypothetical protein QBC45DRAFT_436641 [Copromyces sp. CBS 386.78]|nr:hypothetical protein QBC45DRAFT_436641 [Copromyces sp. CBS 386.78]
MGRIFSLLVLKYGFREALGALVRWYYGSIPGSYLRNWTKGLLSNFSLLRRLSLYSDFLRFIRLRIFLILLISRSSSGCGGEEVSLFIGDNSNSSDPFEELSEKYKRRLLKDISVPRLEFIDKEDNPFVIDEISKEIQ